MGSGLHSKWSLRFKQGKSRFCIRNRPLRLRSIHESEKRSIRISCDRANRAQRHPDYAIPSRAEPQPRALGHLTRRGLASCSKSRPRLTLRNIRGRWNTSIAAEGSVLFSRCKFARSPRALTLTIQPRSVCALVDPEWDSEAGGVSTLGRLNPPLTFAQQRKACFTPITNRSFTLVLGPRKIWRLPEALRSFSLFPRNCSYQN
jgi:hypothetical protein